VFPDHFDHDWRAGSRERVQHAIKTLAPGSPRSMSKPAIDTPELFEVVILEDHP
jgi:chitin disaccharide deacetylase